MYNHLAYIAKFACYFTNFAFLLQPIQGVPEFFEQTSQTNRK